MVRTSDEMTSPKQNLASLHAGTAQVDITPRAGIHLGGTIGTYRPAELVIDPLYAKALVLEREGRKLCFVVLDLAIITEVYSTQIRQLVAQRWGFEEEAVMVHCTQTHTGPGMGPFMISEDLPNISAEWGWLRGNDERYAPFAMERILQAVEQAHEAMQPVKVGVGSGVEGRLAFNRRMVMRDGSIGMPRGGPHIDPRSRYLEGPIDPELGVMCIRADSLQMVAMLASYTCHPVHVFPKPIVSADWPGAWADELRTRYGEACVPLVLNGACGDINPWDPFDPDYARDYRRMGRLLAETTSKVIETLTYTDDIVLDWRFKRIKLRLRELDRKELEQAQHFLEQQPEPVWTDETRAGVDPNWVYAAATIDLHNRCQHQPEEDYDIHILRVGDAAFVGLPGEPFAESGLTIKLASPLFPTYIVHNTYFAGYFPTKEAFISGGYETRTANWSKYVPEATDQIIDAAVSLLQEFDPHS